MHTHTPTQAPISIPPTPPIPPQSIASSCWPVEISRWRGILNSTSHPQQWWRRCRQRGTAGWERCELGGWRSDGHALYGTGRGSATDQSASKLVSQLINLKHCLRSVREQVSQLITWAPRQICQRTSQSTNQSNTASIIASTRQSNTLSTISQPIKHCINWSIKHCQLISHDSVN